MLSADTKRIPETSKAGSDKHMDLYTDEDPKELYTF